MAAQSGLGFSGIAAIQIPDDGAVGEVLTKLSADNYDYDWAPGGGGGGGDVLTLALAGSVFVLTQSSGVSPLMVDLAPLNGLFDHGGLLGLADDDHLQYLLLAGRVGGQTAFGGTAAGQDLTIGGNPSVGVDPGEIISTSGFDVQDISAGSLPYAYNYNPTQSLGVFIGGGFNASPTITFTGATFIWEGNRIAPIITSGVAPGFAAFTLLNALPVLRSATAGFNPLNALTLNVGVTMENAGVVVALTTATNFGVSFSPQTRVTGIFSTMRVSAQTAVSCRPTFSTVNTSTADLGLIRGLHCQTPAVALFQPAAGAEIMDGYIGLDYDNVNAFGDAADIRVVVRSALAANTNNRFLQNNGTAISTLLGQMRFDADTIGVTFGASQDVQMGWAGGTNELFFQFNALANQYRISNPSSGRFLFDSAIADHEFNFNFNRGSFGAQTGTVGNQTISMVTPANRPVPINGSWADILLTHAGNLDLNGNSVSQAFAWSVNGLSITLSGGTVTDAGVMVLGGAADQGTNRYGMLILSNPTGGTLNYALRVTNGDVRFDQDLEHTGVNLGFYGATPVAQPTVTGERNSNPALADLLTDLASEGLVVDSTTEGTPAFDGAYAYFLGG